MTVVAAGDLSLHLSLRQRLSRITQRSASNNRPKNSLSQTPIRAEVNRGRGRGFDKGAIRVPKGYSGR